MTARSARNDEQMARQLWARTTTFADLCELSARYVAGDLAFSPLSGGSIDEETSEIASALVELNRAGMLTSCSQPALIPDFRAPKTFGRAMRQYGITRSGPVEFPAGRY